MATGGDNPQRVALQHLNTPNSGVWFLFLLNSKVGFFFFFPLRVSLGILRSRELSEEEVEVEGGRSSTASPERLLRVQGVLLSLVWPWHFTQRDSSPYN